MSESKDNPGVSRRKVLECMSWVGTGVLWTVSGGVPRSLGIIDGALAAEPSKLSFLQISDSHVGFDKPANPNVIGTLEEAIGKIKSLPAKPSFMIHTGDITHPWGVRPQTVCPFPSRGDSPSMRIARVTRIGRAEPQARRVSHGRA